MNLQGFLYGIVIINGCLGDRASPDPMLATTLNVLGIRDSTHLLQCSSSKTGQESIF